MSPRKRKFKHNPISNVESNERAITNSEPQPSVSPKKRQIQKSVKEEMQAKKRKNFIIACEQVSCRDYFDHRKRLLLVHLPSCMRTVCTHHAKNDVNLKQIPLHAQELFEIEIKNNKWYEALEVCHMCITVSQYLSSDVLKEVVEIILNAHEDEYSEYNTVKHLINKCQRIFLQHFSAHSPCINKNIRKCYNNFLTSPMVLKEHTFTDRTQYECHKGIIKYCFNRLEYELSTDSEDGPLMDKDKNIPDEMKDSVRGLHWQKEKCEIFESLIRNERIERLFAVLESVIELLQFDIAIWHSRYTNDLGRHIMRSHKPLMAYVLWSENVLYTGAVTKICRQILRTFTTIIHLNYPDTMVKIITIWLNTMIQTFYICESNSNMDYPNTSKYCNVFANDFYIIISEFPHDTIIRILERIEPSFMRHLVGLLHINKILSTTEVCIITILIDFIKQEHWKLYQSSSTELKLSNNLFLRPKRTKRKIDYLLKKYLNVTAQDNTNRQTYEKMHKDNQTSNNIDLNHVVLSMYITLDAYYDAYDLQSVQETWSDLNEQSINQSLTDIVNVSYGPSFYSVTESLIKKYRNMLQSTKELAELFSDSIKNGELPTVFNVFEKIGLLQF